MSKREERVTGKKEKKEKKRDWRRRFRVELEEKEICAVVGGKKATGFRRKTRKHRAAVTSEDPIVDIG